jgi:hypothetical protein
MNKTIVKKSYRKNIVVVGMITSFGISLHAQESATEFVEPSVYDTLWGYATLYKDDLNPYIQEFKLRGRYQGQYYDVDADNGQADHWEDRRSRFGFDAKLFDKKLEARFDFQSNDDFDDLYDGLVDAYLRWKPNANLSVTAGKTKPLVAAYDWLSSTNDTPTFERSQIFNQLNINRATALTVEGNTNDILWQAGIYSNSTPATTLGTGDWGDGEFGDLDGGTSYSIGIGHNFHHALNVEKALLRLDWLHSDRKAGDLVNGRYDDIVSTTFHFKEGYWNVIAEAFYATGGDGLNGDVFGAYILPTYDIIPDRLQLVARYSYTNGDGPASVVAQSRYERETPIGLIPGVSGSRNRGDEYHSAYVGAQYFIYGNKLKLMAGAEWAQLLRDGNPTGYEGVTALTGLRLSF